MKVLIITLLMMAVAQQLHTVAGVTDAEIQKLRKQNLLASDKQLQTLLNIDSKWEEYIVPGPMAVATLGQLVVLSDVKDFRLEISDPSKYKYLRHETFRPALIQIINKGAQAFRTADLSMKTVYSSMAGLPRHTHQILEYLRNEPPEAITTFMPIPISLMRTSVNECLKQTKATYKAFIELILLLGEVDEALTSSDVYYRQGLANITMERAIAAREIKFMENMKEQAQSDYSKIAKQLKEDRASYEKALNNIPTGFKAVFFDLVRSINPSEIAGAVLSVFPPLGEAKLAEAAAEPVVGEVAHEMASSRPQSARSKLSGIASGILASALDGLVNGKFRDSASEGGQQGQLISQYDTDQGFALNHAENVFHSVPKVIYELKNFQDKLLKGDAGIAKQRADLANYLTTLKEGTMAMIETLERKGESPWKDPSLKLLKQFRDSTHGLVSILSNKQTASGQLQEPIQKAELELTKIEDISKRLVSIRGFREGTVSRREIASAKTPSGSQQGSVGPERYIASQREAILEQTQRRYDEYHKRLQETSKQLEEVMEKISKLKTEDINFVKIRQVLREGISAISHLKNQFAQLVRFFEVITVATSTTLKNGADEFLGFAKKLGYSAETVQEFMSNDPTGGTRNSLLTSAVRIDITSKFLWTLSGVYLMVSDKYISQQINSLSELQKMSKFRRDAELKKLFDQSKQCQKYIMDLANKKRGQFKVAAAKYGQEIQEMFRTLGKPSGDDRKRIKSSKTIVNIQAVTQPKRPDQCLAGC